MCTLLEDHHVIVHAIHKGRQDERFNIDYSYFLNLYV